MMNMEGLEGGGGGGAVVGSESSVIPSGDPNAAFEAAIADQVSFDKTGVVPEKKATEKVVKKAEEKPAEKAKEPAAKPSKLDKLAPKEEAAKPDEKEGEETPPTNPKEHTRWKQLKADEAWRKEHEPKVAQLQKELDDLKSKYNDEDLTARQKELEELRQFRAAKDIRSTPEYKREVEKPFQDQHQRMSELSEYADVSLTEIAEAMKERNALKRNEKLEEVLKSGGKELKQAAFDLAFKIGDSIQDLMAKDAEFESRASEINGQLETQSQSQKYAAEQKEKEILQNANKEVATHLKVNMRDVLEGLSGFDAAQLDNLEIAKDPMDVVYNAAAGSILPLVLEALRAEKKAHKASQEEFKKRSGLSPSANPSVAKASTADRPFADLTEAMGAHKAAHGRF